MPTYKAILFDNDGVLVDTERLYFEANRKALEGLHELSEAEYLRYFLSSSVGLDGLVEGLSLPCTADELRPKRNDYFTSLLHAEDILIAGVQETIQQLADQHRLAIVSSSTPEHFSIIHQRTGLLPYFEAVVTREQYKESKPSPEPYLHVLQLMNLESADCLVVEDSPRGIESAKRAGLTVWQVASTMQPASDLQPDRKIEQISELTLLLRSN